MTQNMCHNPKADPCSRKRPWISSTQTTKNPVIERRSKTKSAAHKIRDTVTHVDMSNERIIIIKKEKKGSKVLDESLNHK